jgi:uncharacterized protein (DUF111 family)
MTPHPPTTEKVAHIHLDPLGGASGDMFISAILDARPELELGLASILSAAGIPQTIQVRRIADQCGGITGSRFIIIDGVYAAPQAPITFRTFRSHLANSALSQNVRERAGTILTLLGEVEAEIHAVPIEEVRFHELGGLALSVSLEKMESSRKCVWRAHSCSARTWSRYIK